MVGRNVHPLKCGVEDHALTVKRTASTTPLRRPAPGTVRAFTLVAEQFSAPYQKKQWLLQVNLQWQLIKYHQMQNKV